MPKAAAKILPDLETAAPTAERLSRGAFSETRTYEFEHDQAGMSPARRIARTIRDLNASVATRLRRLELSRGQLMAATLFERDHELARLEPRMTADLSRIGMPRAGLGGAGGDGLRVSALQARERKQKALGVLRGAGADMVRLVESVVLDGVSVTQASSGQDRYAHKAAAIAWAGTMLGVGLTLLEGHYRAAGRI